MRLHPATLLGAALLSVTACGPFGGGTPLASPTAATTATPGPGADWTSFGGDRQGYVASAAAYSGPHLEWTSNSLDGAVYGSPLVFQGLVLVATQGDTVYALDHLGAVTWQRSLGIAIPRAQLPCGDIDPSGIVGTPVIDPSTGTLFVVALRAPGEHRLFALNALTGDERWDRAVDPAGSSPLTQQQRGALRVADGRVYITFGGLFGDCGNYRGYVVASELDGTGNLLTYRVPADREAGIWSVGGPTLDAEGDLLVATGNGSNLKAFDHGNAIIHLTGDLRERDFFAPPGWATLSARDLDLGSTAPALVAGDQVLVAGKDGTAWLVAHEHLVGIGGQEASVAACAAAYGAIAVSPDGADAYIPCQDGIAAVHVKGASLSVLWRSAPFPAGSALFAGGQVLVMDSASGSIRILAPADGRDVAQLHVGPVTRFVSIAASGNTLYVPTGNTVIAMSF
ncbi:MAG: outer membrane protein assembly factor BamB family protein [Candidatus Dormibacteria bacterium]